MVESCTLHGSWTDGAASAVTKGQVMRVMNGLLSVLLVLACASNASASSTLRVGSQVLVAGDSAARVTALLGKPSYTTHKRASRGGTSHAKRRSGLRVVTQDATAGEQWQYRRAGHVTIITIVDGRVSDIQERRR